MWQRQYQRTAHQVNPRADAHLLARLHHLEGLVQQHLAGKSVVNDFDNSVRQGEAPPGRVLLHADAAAEGQLENNASAKSIGNVVVPERKIALVGGKAWLVMLSYHA